MNPNQRRPGESYDYFITRRSEWQKVEKMMGQHPRVLYNQTKVNAQGRVVGVPYVRKVHGPLTPEDLKNPKFQSPPV